MGVVVGGINHLSVERLQQSTWLYKEREDWEHSLVSGSCMQTSSWEGGGSTHKAECGLPPEGSGLQWRAGKQNRNLKWQSCGKSSSSLDMMKHQHAFWKDEAIFHDPQISLHRQLAKHMESRMNYCVIYFLGFWQWDTLKWIFGLVLCFFFPFLTGSLNPISCYSISNSQTVLSLIITRQWLCFIQQSLLLCSFGKEQQNQLNSKGDMAWARRGVNNSRDRSWRGTVINYPFIKMQEITFMSCHCLLRTGGTL